MLICEKYMNRFILITFLILTCYTSLSFGGKENYNWVCGDSLGLNFNSPDLYPKLIEIPINIPIDMLYDKIYEKDYLFYKNATISDSSGNYLFHSFNGVNLWNKSNDLIYNYNDAGWDTSFTTFPHTWLSANWQEGPNYLIKKPESDSIYYNFFIRPIYPKWLYIDPLNVAMNFAACYHILDRNLNLGSGGIINTKNFFHDDVSYILPIKHYNGKDIWILVFSHGYPWDSYRNPNISSYRLTKDGLNTQNYVSNIIDPIENYQFYDRWWPTLNSYYEIKINSQGDMIAMNSNNDTLRLLKFDKQTGIIKPYKIIKTNFSNVSFEFSADGSKIYSFSDTIINKKLYRCLSQMDIKNNFKIEIIDTFLVNYGKFEKRGLSNGLNLLQIAPGGRIYGLNHRIYDYKDNDKDMSLIQTEIFIINHPNENDKNCNVQRNYIKLEFKQKNSSFLNKFAAFPYSLPENENPKMIVKTPLSLCSGETIYLLSEINDTLQNVKYTWSGPLGFISQEQNPIITNSQPEMSGQYIVYFEYLGYTGRDTVNITVHPKPDVGISGDTSICSGSTGTLNVKNPCPGCSYKWSTGEMGHNIDVNESGTYTLYVTNQNGCTDTASIVVNVHELPRVTIKGAKVLCEGSKVNLLAETDKPGYTYKWSNGETNSVISINKAGVYSVTVTNEFGCNSNASLAVEEIHQITASIEGNRSFCKGYSTTLKAKPDSAGYSFMWSTGDTSQQIAVSKSGNYSVFISINGQCGDTAKIDVIENENPQPNILGNKFFCKGGSTILSSDRDFATYSWSTGENTKSITITKPDTYSMTVTDTNGCKGSNTIDVKELDVKISGVKDSDLGIIKTGGTATQKMTIINESNTDVEISSVFFKNNNSVFKVVAIPPLPMMFPPYKTLELSITYFPTELKDYSDSLILEIGNPCTGRLSSFIQGRTVAYTTVWLPDTIATIGESHFCIPLRVRLDSSTVINEILSYTAEIRYDVSALVPEDIYQSNVVQRDRVILLSGDSIKFANKEINLGEFCGQVMLANQDYTPLRITNFVWNNTKITNQSKDGSLNIKGLCIQQLARIRFVSLPSFEILNNPASEVLKLKTENIDKSAKVYLYSVLGEQLLDIPYSEEINIIGLPSGLYFLKIGDKVEKFIIINN